MSQPTDPARPRWVLIDHHVGMLTAVRDYGDAQLMRHLVALARPLSSG